MLSQTKKAIRSRKERVARTPEQVKRDCKRHLERSVEFKKILREYKAEHGCLDCGHRNPIVLDFDHREDEIKLFGISAMTYSHGMAKIWLEVAKCDVVCKNCHAIRTSKTFRWAV